MPCTTTGWVVMAALPPSVLPWLSCLRTRRLPRLSPAFAVALLAWSDVDSVRILVERLQQGEDSPVLFYHPQQLDADGDVVEHFCLGICPPFGMRMLQAFPQMPHLDATGGLNILGFPQLTMLVQDEFGNGVPVAFCIAGSECAAHHLVPCTVLTCMT